MLLGEVMLYDENNFLEPEKEVSVCSEHGTTN